MFMYLINFTYLQWNRHGGLVVKIPDPARAKAGERETLGSIPNCVKNNSNFFRPTFIFTHDSSSYTDIFLVFMADC